MTVIDYILIAAVALAVGLALRGWIRKRKSSGCCGDCCNCDSGCGK